MNQRGTQDDDELASPVSHHIPSMDLLTERLSQSFHMVPHGRNPTVGFQTHRAPIVVAAIIWYDLIFALFQGEPEVRGRNTGQHELVGSLHIASPVAIFARLRYL